MCGYNSMVELNHSVYGNGQSACSYLHAASVNVLSVAKDPKRVGTTRIRRFMFGEKPNGSFTNPYIAVVLAAGFLF